MERDAIRRERRRIWLITGLMTVGILCGWVALYSYLRSLGYDLEQRLMIGVIAAVWGVVSVIKWTFLRGRIAD